MTKYYKWYNTIIERSHSRVLDKSVYIERHHIIPRSLGGTDDITNIAKLTAREHFICHWLLIKIHKDGLANYKMRCALQRFKYGNKKSYYNSRAYDYNKSILFEQRSQAMRGPNNHFWGKTHTEKTKKHLSNIRKGKRVGPENSFYGKSHTDETKQKLREVRKKDLRKSCDFCGKTTTLNNHQQFHGEHCKLNPNVSQDVINLRKVKAMKASIKASVKDHHCIYCNRYFVKSKYNRWHGVNCKLNNDRS